MKADTVWVYRKCLIVILAASFLSIIGVMSNPLSSAQSGLTEYNDRATFNTTATNLTVVDFEGLVPASGFTNYKSPTSFTTRGFEFSLGGGGRFGPGAISIVGGWYYAGPIYETTTGAKLTWAPPNQPGDAFLEVKPPSGITAIGADLWTAQPAVSSVAITVMTSDGKTQSMTLATQRPAPAFAGFTSATPISSIRFVIPRGQTALILDNFTFGQSTRREVTNTEAQRVEKPGQAASPSIPKTSNPSAVQPGTSPNVNNGKRISTSGRGDIAYIRGGSEIRLIQPDGTNDRRLWTHPDATKELGIDSLAWRPDGQELVFSSSHAAAASLYHADLYAVRHDGSGFRKVTNTPDRGEFSRYPKGSVTVTLRNDQAIYKQSQASAGVFIVYVAGADEPQQITLPPGATKTIVFNNVADFGNRAQAVVAMWGKFRWFIPGLDVQAGRNMKAPVLSISGDGIELFGAFRPVWKADGSRVSYRSGFCTLSSTPVNPTPGEHVYNPLFEGKNPLGSCVWAWGPTQSTANQLIYTENASGDSSVFRIAEGGKHPGEKLITYSSIEYQLLSDLHWLPDGSGFLFSNVTLMRDSANIFRYDFSTKKVTQITQLQNEFTGNFSISSDGQWIVFERSRTLDDDRAIDLWITSLNGRDTKLLVRDAFSPSWR